MKRCILVGNYGVENLGDEALLQYFLSAFPEMEWTVATAGRIGGQYVPRLPFGVRSFLRPWWKTLWAMARADAVVFGGGSLLTDSESGFACLLWWWHAYVAWAMRRPIVLAFQGIGPVRGRVGKWCTMWVLRRSAYISVRDEVSLQRCRTLVPEITNKKIVQTFDPVLALMGDSKINRTKKLIIIPRINATTEFRQRVDRELQSSHWQHIEAVLLTKEDRLAVPPDVPSMTVDTLRSLQDALSGAGFVLTQRYHGAVAALAMGIPFLAVPQAPGDKLDVINGAKREECVALVQHGEQALRKWLSQL